MTVILIRSNQRHQYYRRYTLMPLGQQMATIGLQPEQQKTPTGYKAGLHAVSKRTPQHCPRFARFIHNSLPVDSITKLQAGSHPNHENSRNQAVRQCEAVHGKYGSGQALHSPSDRITVSAHNNTLSYGILCRKSLRRQRSCMFNSLHNAGPLRNSRSVGDEKLRFYGT